VKNKEELLRKNIYKAAFFETSARTKQNVTEIITTLVEEILKVTPPAQRIRQPINNKKKYYNKCIP
jgi:aspartate carbamoyltransferase catalytic subunit